VLVAHEQLPMKEALFVGTVTHNRKIDVAHGFTYPIWMSFSDLSASRLPRPIRPNSAKYLTVSRIQELLDTQLADTQHDIWLLTQPGLIGRSFNPVSFYFVTEQGAVRWIVAHITNTPWDESHCYVLERSDSDCWYFDKRFHVSPFLPMALKYRWRFSVSAEHIKINMQVLKDDQRIFSAVLNLAPQPLTPGFALSWRLRNPAQNVLTILRIYYQAARLKLKGAPFYAHPNSTKGH